MKNIVNAAIQVLPEGKKAETYPIVDKVIDYISKTGLKYRVCPFETVLEGDLEQILEIVKAIPEVCFRNQSDNIIMNLKIQVSRSGIVRIEDKMKKYDPPQSGL